MIAMAYNLRLLQDRKSGKKARLTRDELQEKIVEGDKGITRLWHRHMGTGFIRPDAGLASKIQRLTDAGVEVAVLTHSFKQGEGEAMEKLEKLGLKGVISEHNIFGLEEISPYKKGKDPEVFEKVLAAINNMRDPADPIRPIETIMAEDTIGNLQGAKKAGMQTVWVPRRDKGMPNRPSRKLQKKLASVDHIYATPHQFLDALDAAIVLPEKLCKGRYIQGAGVTLWNPHTRKPGPDVFRHSTSRARHLRRCEARRATSSNRPQYEGARDRSQYERGWRQSTRRSPT
jgi:FMN phosphatase YigB (HAD superfamily)